MKKLLNLALISVLVYTLPSCSGVRSASGPSGPVTPAAGSASNVTSGRNAAGTPVGESQGTAETEMVTDSAARITEMSGKVEDADKKNKPLQFIRMAMLNGSAVIQLSHIAAGKSDNAYVKAFAAMAIKDRGTDQAALEAMAKARNIQPAAAPADQVQELADKVSQLTASTGAELDNLYIQEMVKGYEQAIKLYEEGTRTDDAELKAYAKKYLPVLNMHLENIKVLNKK